VIKFVSDLQQVCGFLLGTLVYFTNKTDHHNITEILLKVALNTKTLTLVSYYNQRSVNIMVECQFSPSVDKALIILYDI
jgi:hypothetical protein